MKYEDTLYINNKVKKLIYDIDYHQYKKSF